MVFRTTSESEGQQKKISANDDYPFEKVKIDNLFPIGTACENGFENKINPDADKSIIWQTFFWQRKMLYDLTDRHDIDIVGFHIYVYGTLPNYVGTIIQESPTDKKSVVFF